MAKKSQSRKKRKQRKPNVPVYAVPADAKSDEGGSAEAHADVTAAPSQETAATTIDWTKEYPYFATDMRRLGIVVLIMVALLLGLNLLFIYVL
jgi:hypothetical protein